MTFQKKLLFAIIQEAREPKISWCALLSGLSWFCAAGASGMDDLLNSVGDLTDARDKAALELTLASVMFELVGAMKLNLWRIQRHDEGLKLRRRVRLDNSKDFARDVETRQTGTYGRIARSNAPALGAPLELNEHVDDMPALESMPELYSCYVSKTYLRWPADEYGLCRHVFPVLDGREVICVLEIQRQAPMTEPEERLVFGLLRIYRNHLGMLDHGDCDALTGLLNRRTFDETFKRVASRALSHEAVAVAADPENLKLSHVAVVDIDHFKRVNDQFGHPYGDEVIVLLARLMSQLFDETHYLFRFGGEEFVLILLGMTRREARDMLERLRTTVESFLFPQVGKVTVSIGASEIISGDTGSPAFGRADQALYFSKRNGRNQVATWEELVRRGEILMSARIDHEIEMF